ncbi:heat shock 70 kDa protein 12A, partial [Rhizoctonia solani 123E]
GPHHVIRVTGWPGQPAHTGQSRVPTLIWYDKNNKPVSFGAEALLPDIEEAEGNGWRLVSLFKLHLHPEAVTRINKLVMPPPIDGLPLLKVYTDFLRYLLDHTKNVFSYRVLDGHKVWDACHQDMTIILTHPNGWRFQQQSVLRQAVIDAGYISDVKSKSSIIFLSEAEASIHFCLFYQGLYNRLELATTFVVCDAGGSTVDTTAYRVVSNSPVFQIEEIKSSA